MPKKKRSPAAKLAREIQAATGKPYTAALAEARAQLGETTPAAPTDVESRQASR
jgi:hypothetical protein